MFTRTYRYSRGSARVLFFVIAMAMVIGPLGCNRTKPRTKWWQFWRPKATTSQVYDADVMVPPPDVVPGGARGAGDPLNPEDMPPPPGGITEPDPLRRAAAGQVAELQTIYFDYDSADLSPEAQRALEGNAAWLLAHPGYQLQLEGHCDERGTVEYNLNLGDRRAKTVKEFLVGKGVAGDGLHTISYGEERPLDASGSEAAWSKNRRVQFMIYQ